MDIVTIRVPLTNRTKLGEADVPYQEAVETALITALTTVPLIDGVPKYNAVRLVKCLGIKAGRRVFKIALS